MAMSEKDAFDPLAGPAAGQAAPEPLRVGYRRGSASLWQALLVCVLLGALAGLLIEAALVGSLVAALGATFCGLIFVFFAVMTGRALWRKVRGRPLLTLDAHGVTLNSARVTVRWCDIAEVRVVTAPGGVRTVVFVAADDDLVLGLLQGLPYWFARDGINRVGGPIFVRAHDLAIDLEELLAAVHRFTTVPIKQRYVPR